MRPNEYQELANRTICPQDKAYARIGDDARGTQLMHAGIGMAAEAGEFCTELQRRFYYGKEPNNTNLIEELGDMLWYVSEACQALDVTLEYVMQANIRKLAARYKDRYTDFEAAEENRDREAEAKAVEGSVLPPFLREVREAALSIDIEQSTVESCAHSVTGTRKKMGLCNACKNPLSDELVRKLKETNEVYRCPNCLELLILKELMYV